MFELVDSQPSHLISADVLNLTPGLDRTINSYLITHHSRKKGQFDNDFAMLLSTGSLYFNRRDFFFNYYYYDEQMN